MSARIDVPLVPDPWLLEAVRVLQAHAARSGPATSSLLGTGAIEDLETEMCRWTGRARAMALPSASTALRLVLDILGVGPGAEVILPGYDWGASCAAVLQLGGTPVVADVVLPDCTIDPVSVRALLSPRTRAVVVTHLGGVPADAGAVVAVCGSSAVPVVEDCSQALGARLDGVLVGTQGIAAVASFAGKLVDAGEGGVMITDDQSIWREAVRRSQHPARQQLSGIWPPNLFGLETRMHPLAAVLALEGTRRLDERVEDRAAAAAGLIGCLEAINGVRLPLVTARAQFAGLTVPILASTRARSALHAAGVEVTGSRECVLPVPPDQAVAPRRASLVPPVILRAALASSLPSGGPHGG